MKITIQEKKVIDVDLPLFKKNSSGNIRVKIIDEKTSLWAYLTEGGGELHYTSVNSQFFDDADYSTITEEEFLAHVTKVQQAINTLAEIILKQEVSL